MIQVEIESDAVKVREGQADVATFLNRFAEELDMLNTDPGGIEVELTGDITERYTLTVLHQLHGYTIEVGELVAFGIDLEVVRIAHEIVEFSGHMLFKHPSLQYVAATAVLAQRLRQVIFVSRFRIVIRMELREIVLRQGDFTERSLGFSKEREGFLIGKNQREVISRFQLRWFTILVGHANAETSDIFIKRVVNPAWTLPQLLWLKENSPSIFSRLRRILVTKDYVRFRLTGQYLTDTYDAIGTQLFDLRTGAWSPELLELIGYRRDWLPEVHSATELGGTLTELAARDTGLGAGTPVAIGSGDSVVEAAGIGAIEPGHCVIKLGTAANVNLVMQNAQPAAGAITYRHVVDELWFSITATNAGASTLSWFAEIFCQADIANGEYHGASAESTVEALAAASSPGAHGLLFHPYLQGERSPHWDPHLRGNFVGISRRHGLPDFARAVMEGVAFSLRDCFELVSSFGESISNLYLIGGGAKSGLWSQIVCDVLGRTLSKPAAQSAAFGSALLAGIAIGLFADWRHALG